MYNDEFFERQNIKCIPESECLSPFSVRLRKLRKLKGYSQENVSKKLNLANATYGTYENSRYLPDAKTIAKLAVLFDESSDYILGIKDESATERTRKKNRRRNLVNIELSDESVDNLLDISRNEAKKRVFEFLINNKYFEEFLMQMNAYLLFSARPNRDASDEIKEAYREARKIDMSSNNYLPKDAYPNAGIDVLDIYSGLIQETLRNMVRSIDFDCKREYQKEMMEIIEANKK
ncbi:MAG: helix-turn-helix transcriptional regulator [Clostridia bacterium]|nr:helix-turn-helix transcriptional regulator [Clostridia bacterium]